MKYYVVSPLYQYIRRFETQGVPSGAGNGIRVGLQKLFNDNSEEAKLLESQLEILKAHLKTQTSFYI